jgi:hypothetical protein
LDLRHLMSMPFSFSTIALKLKSVETLHLCVSWNRPTPFCLVINETHIIFTSFNGLCACDPHIWMDDFQRFGIYMSCLSSKWMFNLLPQLACFTNF